MYPHEYRYPTPNRSTVQLLSVVAILAFIVYLWLDKNPDVVQPVEPTSYAVPVVQPVQPVIQPNSVYQPTVDAYYAAQTPVVVQPPVEFNRGGFEAVDTPEGEIGVHDPGRTDKRKSSSP